MPAVKQASAQQHLPVLLLADSLLWGWKERALTGTQILIEGELQRWTSAAH